MNIFYSIILFSQVPFFKVTYGSLFLLLLFNRTKEHER